MAYSDSNDNPLSRRIAGSARRAVVYREGNGDRKDSVVVVVGMLLVVVFPVSFFLASSSTPHASGELGVLDFPVCVVGQEILEFLEAGTCIRKHFGQGGADEAQKAGVRLVADSDVVEAERVLVHCAVSQILVCDVIELVEGLMEDHATLTEDFEGSAREAASDEDRNAVQRNALYKKPLEFDSTGVKPLTDVFGLDTSEPRGAMQIEEVEQTFPGYCAVPNVGGWLLLAVEVLRAFWNGRVEIRKSAKVVSIGLGTKGAVDGEFQALAATARNGLSGKVSENGRQCGEACAYVAGRGIRKVEPRRVVGVENLFEFALADEGLASLAQDVGFEARPARVGDLAFEDSRRRNYSMGEDVA